MSQQANRSERIGTTLTSRSWRPKILRRSTEGTAALPSYHLPVSPVPHLLQSNEPPTDEEIPRIREAISIVQSLDETALCDAHNFVMQHRSILSAMRRLPPDILIIIFIGIIPPFPALNVAKHYIRDLPWIVLAQVCRFWRGVALSTPALWSRIPTIDAGASYTREPKYLEFLTEILARSGNGPLDVHIRALSISQGLHPILNLLVLHSARWRRARIDVRIASLSVFAGINGRLDSLHELIVVAGDSEPHRGYLQHTINLFQDAPRLRKVAISGYYDTQLLLPTSSFEEYWQSRCTPNQIYSAISSSSTITTLTLVELSDPPSPWSLMVFPCLITLKIRFPFSTPQNFLDNLVLPIIEELQLISHSTNLLPSVHSLIWGAGRPSRLKKISLKTLYLVPNQLSALLEQVPLLTHLYLSLPPIEDIIALATGDGSLIVPRLQICEFEVNGAINSDTINVLKSLAAARCESPFTSGAMGKANPGRPDLMRAIYIHLDSSDLAEPLQMAFHDYDWPITNTTINLIDLKYTLMDQITKEHPVSSILKPTWIFSRRETIQPASYTLSCIENIDVIRGRDIFISGIHRVIYRLQYRFPPDHPGHKLIPFAKRILERWDPFFKDDLDKVKWAINENLDRKSLVYISESNPLRSSSESVRIVFDISDSEIEPSYSSWLRDLI